MMLVSEKYVGNMLEGGRKERGRTFGNQGYKDIKIPPTKRITENTEGG